MSDIFHFQVNLGGMLDILSNHLYKSPDVFLRELLQNGVDAITMRCKEEPEFCNGEITIRVEEKSRLEFMDNGAGLTEEGIHQFLAVIGQSSKTQLINGILPEDYIGRFGIGLLSCFMISDSIEIHTRPASGGDAHLWKGFPDGTYTLELLDHCPVGTTVILKAKSETKDYFTYEKIEQLVRYYGLALPVPVRFEGEFERLNQMPGDFTQTRRGQLLSFGEWLFDEQFLDAIPIHTPHLDGVAYILPYETASNLKTGHRIYLKQMLLTENGSHLLPSWAFFVRCFLNTRGLRPTASREDFYEDGALLEAKEEFSKALSNHLITLTSEEPERLNTILQIHSKAIKSMAVWDDELFQIFIDYLPFETSEGTLTGTALHNYSEINYVNSVDKFRQLKPLFIASGKLLICSGYTYDQELLIKYKKLFHLPILPLREEELEGIFTSLSPEAATYPETFIEVANQALKPFDCKAEVKEFFPSDLPTFYLLNDDVRFLREIQTARLMSHGIFSDMMTSLLTDIAQQPCAVLYFNMNCPLIQQLCNFNEKAMLHSIVRILYIQAMLVGGHPMHSGELQLMSQELLSLIKFKQSENSEHNNF